MTRILSAIFYAAVFLVIGGPVYLADPISGVLQAAPILIGLTSAHFVFALWARRDHWDSMIQTTRDPLCASFVFSVPS